MSEQQADEAATEPTDTASESPEESSGSSDTGSGESGSGDSASNDSDAPEPGAVSDSELPEDLQATEDNPLARHPRQTGDEDDKIGADSETGNADNPSASMTYGEDSDDSDESGDNEGDDSGDEAS